MRFIFERPLYELSSALDGETALAQVAGEADPFDVVITDNNMPGVSGVEFIRELRQRSSRRNHYAKINPDICLIDLSDRRSVRRQRPLDCQRGEVCIRELRERSFAGKIMVLSAHLSSDARAAYAEMDVDAMIEKPFCVHALRKPLDKLAG